MADYLVEWKVDLEATGPKKAAMEALSMHRDQGSTATVFEVTNKKTGAKFLVDLSEKTCVVVTAANKQTLGLEDRDTGVRSSPVAGVGLSNGDQEVRRDAVVARVWSDDKAFDIKFDAVPWLKEASDKDIVDLYQINFSRDYPADKVAQFMADHDERIAGLFKYLEALHGKGGMGFEVEVNADQMLLWLKLNKPRLFDRYNEFRIREEMRGK